LNFPVSVPLTFAAFLSDPFLKQAFFQAVVAHGCFINKPSSQEDILLSFCHHGMTLLQLVQTSDVESSCVCTTTRNYPVMKWRQTVILWQDVSNRIRGRNFMQHAIDRIKRWSVVDSVVNSIFAGNAEIFLIDLSKISVSIF
jgi:hypothetical protein